MNDIPTGFLSTEKSKKYLGVPDSTLRRWADTGQIQFIRTGGKRTHRYYNVHEFLNRSKSNTTEPQPETDTSSNFKIRRKISYCRVSTRNQRDDLTRQREYLSERYPNHEVITDVGSGINFKRKGLKTILEYAMRGEIEELVVAYKDRLCRFGFDLIEWIIEKFSNGKILVLNNTKCSPEQELTTDVLSIINVFSARINGLRKYHKQIKEEIEEKTT